MFLLEKERDHQCTLGRGSPGEGLHFGSYSPSFLSCKRRVGVVQTSCLQPFLATGIGFVEGNFSVDSGGGGGLGMIQVHCIYRVLYLCYYCISSPQIIKHQFPAVGDTCSRVQERNSISFSSSFSCDLSVWSEFGYSETKAFQHNLLLVQAKLYGVLMKTESLSLDTYCRSVLRNPRNKEIRNQRREA